MARDALIVDDSKAACRVLEGLLEKHHIQATSVHSAEDALEYLRTSKPDVIFLDHNMPGMDGLQAVKIIKSNPATAAIPVLMYTTKEGEVYLGQARALGAVDVLTKDRVRDHLEESLAKLGMLKCETVRNTGDLVMGDELPPRFSAAASNLEEWLQQMQSELSRQMYLILTEEQIAQQEQTKRIAALVQNLVSANNDEIVRRMEGLQELYRAEKLVEARKRRWVIFGVSVMGVIVAAALYWQGERSGVAMRELQVQLHALQSTPQSEVRPETPPELTRAVVESLPGRSEETTEIAVSEVARGESEALELRNRNGDRIGRLLSVDVQAARYQAASPSGYLYSVNRRGQIGSTLQTRYFTAANCVGDPLVEALSGAVYRDGDDQLWFTAVAGDVVEA